MVTLITSAAIPTKAMIRAAEKSGDQVGDDPAMRWMDVDVQKAWMLRNHLE